MRAILGLMGFNTYPYLFSRDLPAPAEFTRRMATWARQQGFDGIEMEDCWLEFYESDAGQLDKTRALLDSSGIAVDCFKVRHASLCHEEVRMKNCRRLLRAVDIAERLGAPIVSVSLAASPRVYDVPESELLGREAPPGSSRTATEVDFTRTVEALREAARKGANQGISIAVELHQFSLTDTAASVLRLLDAVAMPNVGANPDLGNLLWGYTLPPERWEEALSQLAPVTLWWHCKNVRRQFVPELNRSFFVTTALDEGDIDYGYAIPMMREAGYEGGVVIEGIWDRDNQSHAKRALRYVRGLLEEPASMWP